MLRFLIGLLLHFPLINCGLCNENGYGVRAILVKKSLLEHLGEQGRNRSYQLELDYFGISREFSVYFKCSKSQELARMICLLDLCNVLSLRSDVNFNIQCSRDVSRFGLGQTKPWHLDYKWQQGASGTVRRILLIIMVTLREIRIEQSPEINMYSKFKLARKMGLLDLCCALSLRSDVKFNIQCSRDVSQFGLGQTKPWHLDYKWQQGASGTVRLQIREIMVLYIAFRFHRPRLKFDI